MTSLVVCATTMAEIVHWVAFTVELLIAGLLMFWGFRLMKEGWIQQRKLA